MMTTEMVTYRGTVLAEQDRGRISGLLPVFLPEVSEVPTIRWKDVKINARLWGRIKSFMLWSQQKFSSEAQLRLYFNDQTKRWRALVWPQYIGTGLYSEEIDESKWGTDPGIKEKAARQKAMLLKLVDPDKGWYEYGTVHHHCTASAFQSGTDHKDEIDRPGIHITIGHILSEKYDLHARFVINKTLYKVVLEDWIDTDDLHKPTYNKFPWLWATQCFEKPKPVLVARNPYWERDGNINTATTRHELGKGRYYETYGDWDYFDTEDEELPPRFPGIKKPVTEDELSQEEVDKELKFLRKDIVDSVEDQLYSSLKDIESQVDEIVADNVYRLNHATGIDLTQEQYDKLYLEANETLIQGVEEMLQLWYDGVGRLKEQLLEPLYNKEDVDNEQ
jgi:hypothetical protein